MRCFKKVFSNFTIKFLMTILLTQFIQLSGDAHLDAIVEFFKDKKNLRLVIGAGENPEHYAIFKEYTFVLGCDVSDFAKTKIYGPDKETALKKIESDWKTQIPIFVPLEISDAPGRGAWKIYFFNKLQNCFSEIIFDTCTTYLIGDLGRNGLKYFFNALQPGGKFYTTNDIHCNVFRNYQIPSLLHDVSKNIKIEKNNNALKIEYVDDFWLGSHLFYPTTYGVYNLPPDIKISLGEGMEQTNDPQNGIVYAGPTQEYIFNKMKDILESVGFNVEHVKSGIYPLPRPEFKTKEIEYICATKPITIDESLASLKDSLSQLKTKLTELGGKLDTLKQKMGSSASPAKPLVLKEISINDGENIKNIFADIASAKVPVAVTINVDADKEATRVWFENKEANVYIKKIKFNVYPEWGHILTLQHADDSGLDLDELDISPLSEKKEDDLILLLGIPVKRLILPNEKIFRYEEFTMSPQVEFIDMSKFESEATIQNFLGRCGILENLKQIKVSSKFKNSLKTNKYIQSTLKISPDKIVD